MRQRPSMILAITFGLVCIVIGLMLGRPSSGQAPAPVAIPEQVGMPGQVGRYQIAGDVGNGLVKMDTTNGRCWMLLRKEDEEQLASHKWVEIGADTRIKVKP